jgi:hypothetical protein
LNQAVGAFRSGSFAAAADRHAFLLLWALAVFFLSDGILPAYDVLGLRAQFPTAAAVVGFVHTAL